jgi:HEAT repeat protein
VPALQALLADDRAMDVALYVLQAIAGAAAERALLQSLSTSTGATRTAIIGALGERRSVAAVPALAPLLQQPAFATASATALGRIGGDAAADALMTAMNASAGNFQSVCASALLAVADGMRASGNAAGANRLYQAVASHATLPASIRKGATLGIISSSGARAAGMIPLMLRGADDVVREAAISKIADVYTADTIGPVAAQLPSLPEAAQIQLLAVLSTYPGDRVGAVVLDRLRADAEPVRMAALKALGAVGGPSAVSSLAERAADTRGAEQTAAREALGALRGRAVDAEIVARLQAKPADAIAAELLLAIGERRHYAAKPLVTASLTASSPTIRTHALRALRPIGTPSDMSLVLDALLATQDDAERREAERTVVALSQKIANLDGRSRTVRTRLAAETTTEARVRLIGLLRMIGDPTALPVLRTALTDTDAEVVDAAVRAITAWPSSAAREDLLSLARDLRQDTQRLLAIQGLIRVVGLDAYRDPAAVAADLRLAAGYSWRPEERRLILGVLGRFPCAESLDLARTFLKDPSLKAEAQAAIDRITPRLPKEAIRR